jgi:hypothetical protein
MALFFPHIEYHFCSYESTAALINEYGDSCMPLLLIWRTRGDLRQLFPEANKPKAQNKWSMEHDFVYWAVKFGTSEYSNLNVTFKCWDKNVKEIWDTRKDLKKDFPDGYHHRDFIKNKYTLLDWVIEQGAYEYPDVLGEYANWPYIGDSIRE